MALGPAHLVAEEVALLSEVVSLVVALSDVVVLEEVVLVVVSLVVASLEVVLSEVVLPMLSMAAALSTRRVASIVCRTRGLPLMVQLQHVARLLVASGWLILMSRLALLK